MYAKINGGTVTKFPYTFGDLRKDHPNVSFPKNITATTMNKYGMVGVLEGPKPDLGPYQRVQRDALPRRPVIGQYTEEDALDSDMIGMDILANYWMIHYNAVDMFADVMGTDSDGTEIIVQTKAEAEAEYQAGLDSKAAEDNRKKRDDLLTETDWVVVKAQETSTEVPAEWSTYRQALRDITTHDNWPHLEDGDWPTKP
jgi:hypothetical protein